MINKKYYPKFEHSVILFLLVTTFLLLIPFSMENTRQASYISKWNEIYNRMEYLCTVINAHIDDDMLMSMKKAKTPHEREQLLLTIIKPYMRIDTDNVPSKRYKPRYKNGSIVKKDDIYYFNEFYFARNKGKTIIGLKNIHTRTKNDPLFIMMFDVNGILPPNKWGCDIYGLNIYDGGKIQPFGFDKTLTAMQEDCSKTGTAIFCSNYYKIGGDFD